MSSVKRKTVIAAMEMAYDYYSARTLLKRHLRASELDSELQVFDATALRTLIESLRSADHERVAPVIDLLDRHKPEPRKAKPEPKKKAKPKKKAEPKKKTEPKKSSSKKSSTKKKSSRR